MKKILPILILIFSLGTLSACAKTSATNETKHTANLTIEFAQNDIVKFDKIPVKNNETAMTLLESKENIVQKAGFITEINHVSQKPAENLYWMYDVNGKPATVGANSQIIKNGDTIRFYLSK